MSDIKRYTVCKYHDPRIAPDKKGNYVLYSDHKKQLAEAKQAIEIKDSRIDWTVEDNAKKAIEIATMRDLLIKCSNRLKAVSANAYDSESFSLHSEIETALESDK